MEKLDIHSLRYFDTQSYVGEVWERCPELEDHLLVSNYGRIKREAFFLDNGEVSPVKILKPIKVKNKKPLYVFIHYKRLLIKEIVARHFLPLPIVESRVSLYDDNEDNLIATNLVYVPYRNTRKLSDSFVVSFIDGIPVRCRDMKINASEFSAYYFEKYGTSNAKVDDYLQTNTAKEIQRIMSAKGLESFSFDCQSYFLCVELFVDYLRYLDIRYYIHAISSIRIQELESDIDLNKTKYLLYNSEVKKTYIMFDEDTGLYKIGISIEPIIRLINIRQEHPNAFLLAICNGDIEKDLHNKFSSKRKDGEWFMLSEKEVDNIIKECHFIKA